VKTHLEIRIEAVHDTLKLLYDAVLSHQEHFGANEEEHRTLTTRLDAHDLRLQRLESRNPPIAGPLRFNSRRRCCG
jgi:hypothetical protein